MSAVPAAPPAHETAPGFWTLERVAAALGIGPAGEGTLAIAGISTDTRTVAPGELFVALRGERFDAHAFLRDALDRGARALVVSDARAARAAGVPVYVVPDTRAALGVLARYRRRAWGGAGKPVIAVAGSNGKTTTKELLRAALGSVLEVHATAANYNNQIGVPLTLLALPDAADIAVVEVGTNAPGELAALRAIAEPDVAVMTSFGEEHLEGFGDLAGVLAEESEIFAGAALAVVPAAHPEIVAAARARAARVVTVGLDAGDVRPDRWGLAPDGRGEIAFGGAEVTIAMRGTHSVANALLALAVARECGVPAASALAALARVAPPPMRGAWDALGRATLINDAYNANPASVRVAIEMLAAVGGGRQRVIVLGTMRELGTAGPALHLEMARYALASPADIIAGLGEFAPAFAAAGPADPRVVTGTDIADVWPALAERLASDAVILLKASRGVRLERLVPWLEEWARSQSPP